MKKFSKRILGGGLTYASAVAILGGIGYNSYNKITAPDTVQNYLDSRYALTKLESIMNLETLNLPTEVKTSLDNTLGYLEKTTKDLRNEEVKDYHSRDKLSAATAIGGVVGLLAGIVLSALPNFKRELEE